MRRIGSDDRVHNQNRIDTNTTSRVAEHAMLEEEPPTRKTAASKIK